MKGIFQYPFAPLLHFRPCLKLVENISVDIGDDDAQVEGAEIDSNQIGCVPADLEWNRPTPEMGAGWW